ncbi:MAG: nucleotidyltransferase domain-containing protein [Anaerotruncus sp.]|nr:nucleotidyltransferase domain-containing protein [Anaerotruncus sp.]
MYQKICSRLAAIEREQTVQILYAVESGSRAWGFDAPDSDYDVRFLYLRPQSYYLRLEKTRDVLEYPIDAIWDVNGWDLQKALRLLHASNPTLYEWLHSPIIYREAPLIAQLRTISLEYFCPKAGVYHYLSMARNNLVREKMEGEQRIKQYFYQLRPLLASRWILQQRTPPPVLFSELLPLLPGALLPVVEQLLAQKRQLCERETVAAIPALDGYLREQLSDLEIQAKKLPASSRVGWEALDAFFLCAFTG